MTLSFGEKAQNLRELFYENKQKKPEAQVKEKANESQELWGITKPLKVTVLGIFIAWDISFWYNQGIEKAKFSHYL